MLRRRILAQLIGIPALLLSSPADERLPFQKMSKTSQPIIIKCWIRMNGSVGTLYTHPYSPASGLNSVFIRLLTWPHRGQTNLEQDRAILARNVLLSANLNLLFIKLKYGPSFLLKSEWFPDSIAGNHHSTHCSLDTFTCLKTSSSGVPLTSARVRSVLPT